MHFTLKTNPLKRADLDEFVDVLPARQPARAQADLDARRTPTAAGDRSTTTSCSSGTR